MYGEGDDGEGQVGSYAIYFAEGESLAKQGEYKKAIESFTKALEFKADDQPCLVARSKCHLQLGNTKSALEDAEGSLKEDTKYHRGLYQKAEALYQMGDFEYALVFYHRGNKIRPDLQEFKLGIQKAQEAINNSIGTPEHCKLEKTGDLTFFKQQDIVSKKKPLKVSKTTRLQSKEKGPIASEKTMKELLGELYADREYLEKLMNDPGLIINNKDKSIHALVEEGLSYLDSRTEFWRQQKPMYARKREKELKKWKPSPTRPQNPSHSTRPGRIGSEVDYTKYVLKSMEEIDNALSCGDAEKSLIQTQQVMNTVQKLSDDDLPNKLQFIATLHSCIGNAQLELGNTKQALEHFQKDMEIAEEGDFSDAKARALYNIGRAHSMMGDYEKGLELWLKRIPLLRSSEESAWLFHEIGRGYWEIGQYIEAMEYGQKSLTAARDGTDQYWQLNACMLVAQSQLKLDELSKAAESFKTSLDLAMIVGDKESQEAIKKALEDVNDRIVAELSTTQPEDTQ